MRIWLVLFLLLAPPALAQGDGGIVRLIDNPFSTQSYARMVIQSRKLDEKHGFHLVIVPSGSTAASITAVQSGATDLGFFNWIDIARLRTNGMKIFGIGPFLEMGADYFVVPIGSPIQNFGDFKGKKVGIYSKTSVNWVLMIAAARQLYHFDLERDTYPQEASATLLRGLLEQGQLDVSHIFNNLTPDLIVSGKFRIVSQIRDLSDRMGLPSTPFLMWTTVDSYAATHGTNVRAFLAAYREAVDILRTEDDAWLPHARELAMSDPAIKLLRDEMRVDTWSRFGPDNEANIRKTFDVLLAATSPKVMGMSHLPDGFMTLDYQ